jgi:hypothetical protein
MDSFYVTLPSGSSGLYYPINTIANYTTKLVSPLELEPNKWEVGLVNISYSNGYKKRFRHNILRLDSQDIPFPVKDYESMLGLLNNIPELLEPFKKETFVRIFSKYVNIYAQQREAKPWQRLFNSCYGASSVMIDNQLVSHFPARVYNGLDGLTETILDPSNCRTSKVTVSLKDNPDFILPEPVYVYTVIIKTNLVGDSFVRLLTTLHFPSSTGYHTLDIPLYRPVEQSFIVYYNSSSYKRRRCFI